jgi:peptide/nickel transport system substrate-binding protein
LLTVGDYGYNLFAHAANKDWLLTGRGQPPEKEASLFNLSVNLWRVPSMTISRILVLLTAIVLIGCQRLPERPNVAPTAAVVEHAPPTAPTPVAVTAEPLAVATTAATAATPEPTATPVPPFKQLSVCMVQEPQSLFLYGDQGVAEVTLRHALYENLYTNLGFEFQAQALEKLPNLEDGDATIERVTVSSGDLVVDTRGNVSRLHTGVPVRAANGDVVIFAGNDIEMPQMVVRFTFRPLVWSDGTPVTAADSVFSFNVAAAPEIPGSKARVERTASYLAEDDLTVVWTGLPGYLDTLYFTNVWSPLPRRQWAGISPGEMLTAELTARRPLSHGPFVVAGWNPGEGIRLEKNPHYYRAAEGLPHLDEVTFTFLGDPARVQSELLAGNCDVATQDGLDVHLIPLLDQGDGSLPTLHVQTGPIFEHIAFGIVPVEEVAERRRNWFSNVQVRQAITMCTDRQQMVDELLHGGAPLMHAYIPPAHPLYPPDLAEWPYDVAAANALLDEVGFRRGDEDGIRLWPRSEIPFRISLGSDDGAEFRVRVNEMFRESVAQCGIEVETYQEPVGQWYGNGPSGTLFGRRFDLATFAWLVSPVPPCHLYLADAIPGPPPAFIAGWSGRNVTGWGHPDFDAACLAAQNAFLDTAAYRENHQQALRIFAEELPMIPLFPRLKVAATLPEVLNFHLDPTQPSSLWNIFEIDVNRE